MKTVSTCWAVFFISMSVDVTAEAVPRFKHLDKMNAFQRAGKPVMATLHRVLHMRDFIAVQRKAGRGRSMWKNTLSTFKRDAEKHGTDRTSATLLRLGRSLLTADMLRASGREAGADRLQRWVRERPLGPAEAVMAKELFNQWGLK